jgi:hypothetical protein
MQLWLNRTGEVSLREQMITQIVLAILCRELAPGDRLRCTLKRQLPAARIALREPLLQHA